MAGYQAAREFWLTVPMERMVAPRTAGQVVDSGGGRNRHRRLIDQAEGTAGSSLSPPNAVVRPCMSATVTVSAEWPVRRNGDGTFSAK